METRDTPSLFLQETLESDRIGWYQNSAEGKTSRHREESRFVQGGSGLSKKRDLHAIHRHTAKVNLFHLVFPIPEGVAIPARVVASGNRVELVAAGVVLDHVLRGSLLDVHALVAVGGNAIRFHKVVVTFVGAVAPLIDRIGGGDSDGMSATACWF